MSCNVLHPERAGVACVLTTSTHPNHMGTFVDQGSIRRLRWPNDEYVSAASIKQQGKKTRSFVSERAQQIRDAVPEPTKQPKRLAKGDSAGRRVAQYLLDHVGEWTPGVTFTDPRGEVQGGHNGLVRVRKLREFGWIIEHRPDPDPQTFVHQYRLAERPENLDIYEL